MIINKKFFLFWFAIIFLFFIAFSYTIHKNIFTQFDFDMTVRLQDHISRKFDATFSLLSTIGSVEVAGVFLFIILAIRRKLSGIFILFAFAFFHLFEIYGKLFVRHLPPPHFMLRTQQFVNFPQFYVSSQNSYPSGHSARAVFITAIIAVIIHKTKKLTSTQKILIYLILFSYDMLMITSRIYLGEHWTSDTIGGLLLGLAFALFSGVFIY